MVFFDTATEKFQTSVRWKLLTTGGTKNTENVPELPKCYVQIQILIVFGIWQI